MTLKDNLKVFREQAGYKQAKEFAKFAGIPYSSYSAYERGSWPNEENLVKLATALNVSVDTLIGFKQGKEDELQKYIALCNNSGIEARKVDTEDGPCVRLIFHKNTPECFTEIIKADKFLEIVRNGIESPDYKKGLSQVQEFLNAVQESMLLKTIIQFLKDEQYLEKMTQKANEIKKLSQSLKKG